MPFPDHRLNLPRLVAGTMQQQQQQQQHMNTNPHQPSGGQISHFTYNHRHRHSGFRTAPYPTHPRIGEQQHLVGLRGDEERSAATLYVSNLDYAVTDRDLELLFSDVGELVSHSIHCDRSGRSKGTAEVVYKNHSDALAAIERYNNHRLDGKTLEIKLVGHDIVKTVFLPPTINYLQEKASGVFHRLGSPASIRSFRGPALNDFRHERCHRRLRNGVVKVNRESQQWGNANTEFVQRRNVTTENKLGKNVTTGKKQMKSTFYGDTTVTFEDLDADLAKYRLKGREKN